jgi:hypothetical protein
MRDRSQYTAPKKPLSGRAAPSPTALKSARPRGGAITEWYKGKTRLPVWRQISTEICRCPHARSPLPARAASGASVPVAALGLSVWIDLSRCQTWQRRLILAEANALLPDLGRSERPSIRHCPVPESQLSGEKVISTVTAFVWIGF